MEAGPLLPCVVFSHVDTLFVVDAVNLELLYIIFPHKSHLSWYYSVCGSFCFMPVMLLNRDAVHLSAGVESPFVITSGAMSNYGPNGLNRMSDNCMLLPAKYFGCFLPSHAQGSGSFYDKMLVSILLVGRHRI